MFKRHQTVDSRRGALTVMVACLIVFILMVAACAIDMGYLWVVQTEAQAVADAAALAGAADCRSARHKCCLTRKHAHN